MLLGKSNLLDLLLLRPVTLKRVLLMLFLHVRTLYYGDGDDECEVTDSIDEQHPENGQWDDLVSCQVHIEGLAGATNTA